MDPNIKLLVEELVKQMWDQVREEICEGFSMHNATINMHFSEFESAEHQREQRVAALESVASSFNKCLSTWKPKVDASLTFVKLELSKLNSFFDREAKSSTMPAQVWSTSGRVDGRTTTCHRQRQWPHWAPRWTLPPELWV
jgi:hypothetical protein